MKERPSHSTLKATQASIEAALEEIPLFPLPHVVLFPRAVLPLHIFEPRYRTMLADALSTHSSLAVPLVAPGGQLDAANNPRICRIAGAGAIIEHHMLADGRSNVVLHGVARIEIEELPFVPPYRRAKGKILHDIHTPVKSADRTALLAEASAFAAEVYKRDPNFSFRLPPSLEPGAIADVCAHSLVIDSAARQRILEQLDVAERVKMVLEELVIQHGALLKEGGRVLH